jgi:uncharacterized repeat protein (TIGR02543 family)
MKRFLILALAVVAFAADPIVPSTPKLESDGCYAISTPEELYGFADVVNASKTHGECGKLTADISLNYYSTIFEDGHLWSPIKLFRGVFDGQNHIINGLHYLDTTSSDVGLFANLQGLSSDKPAVVKNLGLALTNFSSAGCVGGIAGSAADAEITNSNVAGSLNAREYRGAGGLVGCAKSLKIRGSYNNGYVGYGHAGGLVGVSEGNLFVENSYNMQSVSGDSTGGIVGIAKGKLEIVNSFTVSKVSGTFPLVGVYDENETVVENSFYFYEYGELASLGTPVEKSDLNKGLVVELLSRYNKNGVDGSVWGQRVGVDSIPQLIGVISVNSPKVSIAVKDPQIVDGCYQIGSVDELYGFALLVNSYSLSRSYDAPPSFCAKLTKDIVINKNVLKNDTLNGNGDEFISWLPINRFSGSFDGAGHSISGLYFNGDGVDVGLFGSVLDRDENDVVKIENLSIDDSYFNARANIGAIVGAVEYSTNFLMKNCHSSSYLRGRESIGMVGAHKGNNLTIEESHNEDIMVVDTSRVIYNDRYVGGLIGEIDGSGNAFVVNSYSVANISPEKMCEGSLVGGTSYRDRLTVVNSYGIDSYAKKNAKESRPLLGCIYNGSSANFYNAFAERSEKRIGGDGFRGESPVSYVDAEYFSDGTVATLLHNYVSHGYYGTIWGQNPSVDSYPVFSGSVSSNVASSDLELVTFSGDTVSYFDKYKEGIITSLPIPSQKDEVFKGWYVNFDFTGEPVKYIPEDAKGKQTFYARWEHYPLLVNGCYEIANAKQLYFFVEIADSLKKPICGKLVADIVVNENVLVDGKFNEAQSKSFVSWPAFEKYHGVFDGNGHTISGLYGGTSFIGSTEEGDLIIKNLGIEDSYFSGGNYTAGFVSKIDSVNLVIANSYFDGLVDGNKCVGGFAGRVDRSKTTIISSSNRGTVIGFYDVGGFIGISDERSGSLTVAYSYNAGDVVGLKGVAGFVGEDYTDSLHISNSYNVGYVYAQEMYAGGFAAAIRSGSAMIFNSYNLGKIVSPDSADAISPYKGKYLNLKLDSVFYENSIAGLGGTAVATEDFANKKLLKRLQSYKNHGLDGSAWTQSDSDKYPVLNKSVSDEFIDSVLAVITAPRSSSSSSVSSSSSAKEVSSSSVPQSSSSVKSSSSSVANSSSSSVSQSSSSSVKSSSSSVKSSSSSSVPKSSSSGKVSIASAFAASPVAIRTQGRMVEISGLRVGEAYALMDLQGRLLQQGLANGSTVMLQVAQSGRFLLRTAGRNKIVNIR